MSSTTTSHQDVAEAPVLVKPLLRRIFQLGTPSVLEHLIGSSVFLVDAIMLARVGQIELAATALTAVVLWRLMSTMGITQVGAGAYVARRWGEERFKEAAIAVAHTIVMGAVIGVGCLAVFWPISRWIYVVLGADPEVADVSASYFRIILLVYPARLALLNITACMRAAGDTRTPLGLMLLMVLMNIGFNYVFIFGKYGFPALGMDGAAVATALTFVISCALGIGILIKGLRPRRLMPANEGQPIELVVDHQLEGDGVREIPSPTPTTEELRIHKAGWRFWLPDVTPRILRVSWPAFWEEVLVSIGFLGFMYLISQFGRDSLAAYSATVRVESFSFTAGWGIAVATGTLVGQALGAKQIALARRLFSLNTVLTMLVMGIFGAVMMIWPRWFLSWFNLEPRVMDLSIVLMYILGIHQSFIGSTMTLGGGLRGAGDTFPPFVTQIVGTIGIRLGLGWALAYPMGMGVIGVYWATVFDWLIRTIVLIWFVKRGKWIEKSV